MRWFVGSLGLVVGAFWCVLVGTARAERSLDVVSLTQWPPYSSADLAHGGFGNEVATTALKRAGYSLTLELVPWSRAIAMLRHGRADVLVNVWHTPPRTEIMAFTEPIARNELVFVHRKATDLAYSGLDSLAGMDVGILRDYDYKDAFMQDPSINRLPAGTLLTNLRNLKNKRLDAVLADRMIARYVIANKLPEAADRFAVTDKALSARPLRAAVSRAVDGTDAIVADFNAALAAMRKDGAYAEIKRRHGLD
jgi:polar amino acid transport system substrate-binding protein